MQIVHLKRFQFVNNRWIKSQKIVRFPRDNFDPSAFLTPREVDHNQQGWRGGPAEDLSEQGHGTNSGDPPSTPTSFNVNNIKGQLSAITVHKVEASIQMKLNFECFFFIFGGNKCYCEKHSCQCHSSTSNVCKVFL